jgi:mono/diheme cytochrome c family protein
MIRYSRTCLLLLALFGGCAAAQGGRGELLYQTYCQSCHTEQLHWRDKKVAADWTGLVAEVRRWQANGNLDWTSDDVEAVVRYLNTLYYRYPEPEK